MRHRLLTLALAALSIAQNFNSKGTSPQIKELSNEGKARDAEDPVPLLIYREEKPIGPEGEFMGTEPVSKPGKECAHWIPNIVIPRDKAYCPTLRPKCGQWEDLEEYGGEHIFYNTTIVKVVGECPKWKIAEDGIYVRPYCDEAAETELSEAVENGSFKRSTAAIPPMNASGDPPKGLLKEVQKTVHTLQSQLAQAQHQQHLLVTHGLDHVTGVAKQNTPTDEQSMLKEIQRTVHSMQTRLAKAKFSIHAHFSKDNTAHKPTAISGGVRPGFLLQDLQHVIHKLQAQLAKSRHVLHAHSGSKVAADQMVNSGLDQGVLQGLQHTAQKLQSQLSEARHTLRAHVFGREALPAVDEDEIRD